jgi:hypothetical protein
MSSKYLQSHENQNLYFVTIFIFVIKNVEKNNSSKKYKRTQLAAAISENKTHFINLLNCCFSLYRYRVYQRFGQVMVSGALPI